MSSASSHSESRSITISTYRSRVLDPSGDSRSTIALSSSEGATLVDSGASEALAAMRSCFNVDSTITTRRLVKVRKHYYSGPKVPATPYDRGVPQRVANLSFPDGAQLIALSGDFPVGMLWGVKDMNEAWLAEAGLSPNPPGYAL
ncbi:hypothetical protein GW17_00059070, partial [Ensete ventricosum]